MTDEQIIRALKALAEPTRFRIVQEIARAGELSCGEVGALFDLAQPTISHHVKTLLDAGVLVGRNEARNHYIALNRDVVDAIATLLPRRLQSRARTR
jgi:ArsR family transcriptional regulator